MLQQRRHIQQFALWLAVAAVLLRALLPEGFMPVRQGHGVALQFCYASPLARLHARDGGEPAKLQQHAECAFAAAAAPALPGGGTAAVQFPPVSWSVAALPPAAAPPPLHDRRPPARAPPAYS